MSVGHNPRVTAPPVSVQRQVHIIIVVTAAIVNQRLTAGKVAGTRDEDEAGLLRRLVPGASESGRLVLFQADLYAAAKFAPAVAGCQFVFFLVATPFQHDAASTKYKSTAEAALDAARVILRHWQCADSKTVRRVIHTGSISACSPLKEDSTGFKDAIDESCWTPLNVRLLPSPESGTPNTMSTYILSKVASEKELLAYNAGESPAFEVVTLACSVVAGDTLLSDGASVSRVVSPVTRDASRFGALRVAQRLAGSVPLVHVDDACDALVFCMERPSMAGRFLCAAAYPTITDIVDHFAAKFPHLELLRETETLPSVQAHSDKLDELGFRYKYGVEEILDCSIDCAVRCGLLDASKLIVRK